MSLVAHSLLEGRSGPARDRLDDALDISDLAGGACWLNLGSGV